MRTAGDLEVEEALLTWFKSTRDNNVTISGPFMMSKGDEFVCRLRVPDGQFKCSSGQLEWFKQRHGIPLNMFVERKNL